MQRAAGAGNEAAALFLATHGAKVNHRNKWVKRRVGGKKQNSGIIWNVLPKFHLQLVEGCRWSSNQAKSAYCSSQ